jgi:hypothetical protein
MLGGAREFRYDWILLRARNLPHEAGDQRPSCSARIRRGASRQISPSCQSYGKSDLDLLSAFFRSSVGRAHAPIITCLAESNPLQPTRCIRLERRLRCNRGLARPLPIIGVGLAIMIASATVPQCFCKYRHDFFDRHSQRLFCCVAAAVFGRSFITHPS